MFKANIHMPYTTTVPEQEQYPFGRWQYRLVGTHLWITAIHERMPHLATLYYKRDKVFTYRMGVTEWRWSK